MAPLSFPFVRRKTTRRTKGGDEAEQVQLDDGFVREAVVIELSAERRAAKWRREALQRELDEGNRQAALHTRPAGRARIRRRALWTLAFLAVVSVLGWSAVHRPGDVPASSWLHEVDLGLDQKSYQATLVDLPPPSSEAAAAPLGRPAPLASESDRFAFMLVDPESSAPVAYDPCRPIHVVVNNRAAPSGAAALVTQAVEAVQAATGLRFLMDGETDEAPSSERPPYQPDRYPARWAPVLLAWSDPVESPSLAGRVAGSGGSTSLSVGEDRVYVTGTVTLDGPQFRKMLDERGGHAKALAVLQHELAHLVGLDHVQDRTQLMNPIGVRGQLSFGAGDLTGLARLGQGRCFPTL